MATVAIVPKGLKNLNQSPILHMKKLTKSIMAVVAAIVMMPALTANAEDMPTREHRAIWMTPYLGNNWPNMAITETNATSMKKNLDQRLDLFRDYNINVLYYHCRTMCDAMYDSAYEPWSSTVSGTRGVAPAFDPFGYLIESAHGRGLEVFAWINPYRYCGATKYGDKGGDLNYENSHPDWLISQSKETILNPGLEEVKQRIVDVIVDIITKYDVDGVVFDDYFYTNGTPMSLDAAQYKKYTDGGGKLSQADWRRANVNEMVDRVNKAIKSRKPWVVFGISPAGVASPPNVTTEYGLPAAPGGGDWQYNGIYSDPLAWYKAGSIDFMSPQIYWPGKFESLSEWWANAAVKYNRHCYPSIDLSVDGCTLGNIKTSIRNTREFSPAGTSGLVYFQYGTYNSMRTVLNGQQVELGANLASDVCSTKVLTPLRPWTKSTMPDMVTNVKKEGSALKWDANAAGRYVVYRLPKNETAYQLAIDGITYTNSYALPAGADDYDWFVAAYDRYGNVTAPLAVGAVKQTGTAPKLTYPANGEKPVDLFEFKWEHESNLNIYAVEVAEDAAFEKVTGIINVKGKNASVAQLPPLTNGKTYYWRVRATDVNREHPVSETRSFVAPRIALQSPAADATDVSTTPTFTWSKAVDGAQYTLEISKTAEMTNTIHTATVNTATYTVPSKTLTTGTKYYARVTASTSTASSVSETVAFATVNKTDYSAPVMTSPAKSGVTLHSNDVISVQPWEGMNSVIVEVASSDAFAARTSYIETLSNFETKSVELSKMAVSSKALVDGSMYYVRVRGSYYVTTSTSMQYTPYSAAMTFVYSSHAGVDDLTTDEIRTTRMLDNATLLIGDDVTVLTVYSLTGAMMRHQAVTSGDTVDLTELPAGIYVIRAGGTTIKMSKY